jgi:UDP-glucose 4-epimerase
MNILLTGGAGYIGGHTAIALARLGHEIVLYDNMSNSSYSMIDRLNLIVGRKLKLIVNDVRNTELLKKTMASHRIDAVIHFAGLKAVAESIIRPIQYFANNVQGTISLLEAMQTEGIKSLVFSSSATIYGEPQYLPLDEDHPVGAINPYGRSKLQIEEILKDVATSDPDWRIACLRYYNPIGAHESGLIGDSPNGTPNNLMPYIAQVASGRRKILKIFGKEYPTTDGTAVRDYIHIMDLAEGHERTLQFLSQKTGWHPINVGTGRAYSVLEVVKAFENASGRKVPYEVVGRRSGDVAVCYANPKKANKLLNWIPCRTLEDMCMSAWKFQLSIDFGKC